MLQLSRIKLNKETKEQELVDLYLEIEDVICLYQNYKDVFLITKQGFTYRVPYKMDHLQKILEI